MSLQRNSSETDGSISIEIPFSCICTLELFERIERLYKRLELGAFNWPRTKEEAMEITPEQYQYLMQGLEVVARHPIQEVRPDKVL